MPEIVEIEDNGEIFEVEVPDGMSDADVLSFIRSSQASPDQGGGDFSVSEMVSNIPSSAVQLGKDIIAPILSPIETAKNLQSLGQGLVEKAMPSTINGVDFGKTQGEEVVDAVGQFFAERYGSTSAIKNTLEQDPAGVVSDVIGIVTGGIGLVKGVAKGAGKAIPKALPEALLESSLKFRPSISPVQRANMTKTALREGILPTVSGLHKLSDRLGTLNTELNKIIEFSTKSGKLIPKNAIFSKLKALRKDIGGVKVNATSDLRIIDRVARQFNNNLKRIKKDRITPRELQDFKTDAYSRINFDIQQGQAGYAKNEAVSAMAKQAKESLEAIDPNVKVINQQMGDLLELNKELESVVGKLDNRNLISLDTAAKVAAGTATGTEVGTAVGVGSAVLGNPRVKARSAMLIENMRKNAETIEAIGKSLPPVLAESLLVQAGRLNESLAKQLEDEQSK